MEEEMEKVSGWYEKIVKIVSFVLFVGISFFMLLVSCVYTSKVNFDEFTFYYKDSVWINIICLLLIVFTGWWIRKFYKKIKCSEVKKKNLWYGLLALYGVLLAAFVFYLRLPPRADQKRVLEIAMNLIGGDYAEFSKGGYVDAYPNQVGIIYICYVLFKFIPAGYHSLRLINVLSIVGSVYCMNEICNILFNKQKKEKKYIYGIFMMLFLPMIGYVTFLYGNNLGMALSLAGILCICKFMKEHKNRYIVGAIILLAFSVVAKENYMINIIGVLIVLLYDFLKSLNKKTIFCMLGIVLGTFLLSTAVNVRVESITGVKISKGVPSLAWVVMGLQEGYMADGWHNGYNFDIYQENNADTEETLKVVKKDLNSKISEMKANPVKTTKFFYQKTVSQWNNPSFECFWINDLQKIKKEKIQVGSYNKAVESVLGEPGNPVLYEYMNLFQSTVWLGVFLWIILSRKKVEFAQCLFMIIFLGGFIFHTVWEAKCQYVMPYFILILPYAIMGYMNLYSWIEERKSK